MLVNPCYHSNFCLYHFQPWRPFLSSELRWKDTVWHHLREKHHGKHTSIFNGKSEDPARNDHSHFLKFPLTHFFPPQRKSHGADRYTCTAMTPSTVGPLCPTGFESKSLAKWAHSRQEGVQFSRHLGRGGFIHPPRHVRLPACTHKTLEDAWWGFYTSEH